MGLFGASIIFAIAWWLVFLAALPIGVRSQYEDGSVVEGTEAGAPVEPQLKRKAVWATIGAGVLTLLIVLVFNLVLASP